MLAANGYQEEWRRKVISKALIGYQRVLKLVDEKKTTRNRLGKETKVARRAKKLTGSATWFQAKKKREEESQKKDKGKKKAKKEEEVRTPDNVFFVPYIHRVS